MRALLLATFLTVVSVTSTFAQNNNCVDREEAVNTLDKRYGERLYHQALTSKGNLLEVFINEEASTWTVVMSTPEGLSCLMSAGEDWTEVTPSVSQDQEEG